MTASVVVGVAVAVASRKLRVRHWKVAGIVAGCVISAPVPAVLAVMVLALTTPFVKSVRRRRLEQRIAGACVESGELIALALAGGFSVAAAVQHAGEYADPLAQPALVRLAAEMSEGGAAAALATHDGPLSGVSRALATAASSGAPAIATLQAYLDVESHRRHAAAVEAARKLPVRMLVPLTLLVLPGFVLVTVAPLVIDSLARLDL